jgi:hypothetical protein
MHEQPALNIGTDFKTRINRVTNKFAIVVVLCSSPVFLLFAHLGAPARGAAAFIGTATILIAISPENS